MDVVRQPADAIAERPGWQGWWHGRFGRRLPLEVLVVVAVYQGYKWARLLTKDYRAAALRNADRVSGWERRLGLLVEDDLQRFALQHPDIIWFLNRYYSYVHFSATLTFLVWLYVRHGDVYGRVRRVLLGTTLVALVVHVLFPLAPPRLLPRMGFVDTISRFGPKIYQNPSVASVVNQIAAMPSLHFGWAIIVAWAVIRSLRHPLRWTIVLHPVVTLAAIVFTANHWWLDAAIAAVIVVAVASADARLLPSHGIRPARSVCDSPGPAIHYNTQDELVSHSGR